MPEPYLTELEFSSRLNGLALHRPLEGVMEARIGLIQSYRPCPVCKDHVHRDRAVFISITLERPVMSGPLSNFSIALPACDRCAGKLLDDNFKKLLDKALKSTDRGNP